MTAAPDPAAPDPAGTGADDVPSDATPLADVLATGARQNFTSTFEAVDRGGTAAPQGLRCSACATVSDPAAVERLWTARLEGASDPADMLHVSALRCPSCGTGGMFVANYGPEADGSLGVLQFLDPPQQPPPAID